jgi:LmbE family N-acetylglucosaminyl deacetylase
MARHRREGHDVCLLTLTRGGATKVRHELGLSVDEMGDVRFREMEDVSRILDLTRMTVLDLPDSRLKEVDPREIEEAVANEVRHVNPDVLVGYPVHGISGFHDHLVAHAVIKRVFCELRQELPRLRRLAMPTLTAAEAERGSSGPFRLHYSNETEIDALVGVTASDVEKNRDALRCYRTYQEMIAKTGVIESRGLIWTFEIFDEEHDPPLGDLFESLSPLDDNAEQG